MGRMAEVWQEQQEFQADDDYAAYCNDLNQREKDAFDIIEKARHEAITDDEAALLRWASGV